MRVPALVIAILALAAVAFCQPTSLPISPFASGVTVNAAVPDAYQVHTIASVTAPTNFNYDSSVTAPGSGFIDITNTGALGADQFGPGGPPPHYGDICVNIYVFTADEQEVACCSCLVTPNAAIALKASKLTASTLTGVNPSSVTVKLLATIPGTPTINENQGPYTGTTCNAATVIPTATGNTAAAGTWNQLTLAPGMRAWAVTAHVLPVTPPQMGIVESEFSKADLSPGEFVSITTRCANIVGNGSGAGACDAACVQKSGVLGAAKVN